jgi:hypothetical protein
MTTTTLAGMRMIAAAMVATDNYAAQIEVGGRWQTVISNLSKEEAERFAAKWDRSRVVQTY